MATLTFTDLYNELLPHIGNFPKNVALRRLYQGARNFCQDSEAWLFVETQDVVADQNDYTLALPAGISTGEARIKRLKRAWYGEDSAERRAENTIQNDRYDFEYPTTMAIGEGLEYKAALTAGLTTQIVLVPTLDDHLITAEMIDLWGVRAFMAWAAWNILSKDDEDWTDLRAAAQFRGEYDRAVTAGKGEVLKERKGGDLRVIPRPFV